MHKNVLSPSTHNFPNEEVRDAAKNKIRVFVADLNYVQLMLPRSGDKNAVGRKREIGVERA